MSLKDYNLTLVNIEGRGVALQPISECQINDAVYKCDSSETDEEKLYIPIDELELGCVMNIKHQKKAYFIRIQEFFWKWYVYIWELPYKEDTEYSVTDVYGFVDNHTANASFPLK